MVAGIDELISRSFSESLKKNLPKDLKKEVGLELFKKYGISIQQGIKDYGKVHEILLNFLGSDLNDFEKKCLSEVLTLKIKKQTTFLTFRDKDLVNNILKILGDDELRKIIEKTISQSRLNSEIISICNLPKTSAYRKINYLKRNGLLIDEELEFTSKRRAIPKITTIFQKIQFEWNYKQKIVELTIPLEIVKKSSSLTVMGLV